MPSPLHELRARLSFPEQSRPLADTAEIMSAWARSIAATLAPELRWDAEILESGELATEARWGSRYLERLVGRGDDGAERGRGDVRLVAGGEGRRIGGNGLIHIEAVGPARFVSVDNHCNVTHWDLLAAPLDEPQIDRVRRALEDALGARAQIGGERREPMTRAAQLLVSDASTDDAALWMEDLGSVGVTCRGHTTSDGVTLIAERAFLPDMAALAEARVALGEVLSEAGHADWHERARDLLIRLP